jgi:hypothetical protein
LMADCEAIHPVDTAIDCLLSPASTWRGWLLFNPQITAVGWIVLPPIGLFAIGYLGLWVGAGFGRNNSN